VYINCLDPVIEAAIHSEIRSVQYTGEQLGYYNIARKHAGQFCGFIFPAGVWFNECTLKNADFSYAQFFGQVRFWNANFIDCVRFVQARFHCESVSFDTTQFEAGFSFAGSSFNTSEGVFFNDLHCSGKEASYRGSSFKGNYVTFNNANIDTDIVDLSHMNVDCDGVFQLSGEIHGRQLISFERSTFVSPIYLFSSLTAPTINFENLRFLDKDNKHQRSKFRARIEGTTEVIWDAITGVINHEFALCRSRLVGSHLFRDCNHIKIIMSTCTIDKGADVLFQNSDMTNIHFYGVDLDRINFLGCSWPKKGNVSFIADDPTKGGQIKGWYSHPVRFWRQVTGRATVQSWVDQTQKKLIESERLYRQLKVKYDSMGEPALAGDFYLRELSMKSKQLSFVSASPLHIYSFLSCYGESWLRSSLLWVLIWAAGSYWLMLNDMNGNFVLDSLRSMLLLNRDGSWGITLLKYFWPYTVGSTCAVHQKEVQASLLQNYSNQLI